MKNLSTIQFIFATFPLPSFPTLSVMTSSFITWITICYFESIRFFPWPSWSSNTIDVWIIFPKIRINLLMITRFGFGMEVIWRIFIRVMVRFWGICITVLRWRLGVITVVSICCRRFLRYWPCPRSWSWWTWSTITVKWKNLFNTEMKLLN